MKTYALLAVLCAAIAVHASDRTYKKGVLSEVVVKDMTVNVSLPFPLHLGIDYQFQIQADDVLYVANCWSRGKRNYGSEWVIKDPVEFRVEKDKLMLKRPPKGELRLGLMTQQRIISTAAEKPQLEPLPPFAARQTVPECH